MTIDCHGQCTTAPRALQRYRERQLAESAHAVFYWFTGAIGSSF